MRPNKGKIGLVVLLLVATAITGGYFMYFRVVPCEQPIKYKIGTLDPGFGVSREQFLENISEASDIWGEPIGRKLFVYDPKGDLTMNLVYDSRQKLTQEESRLNTKIDQNSAVAASVKDQYAEMQADYARAVREYEAGIAQFDQAQRSYGDRVEYWNKRGGAPKAEYALLTAEKEALAVELESLETKRLAVNALGKEINALIDRYNLLVDHINTDVKTFNNDGLAGTQFEQGVYTSDRSGESIDIYQFENRTYFIRVLAHELGHALDLDHNDNPDSIMNPINRSQSLVASTEDLGDLKVVCGMI